MNAVPDESTDHGVSRVKVAYRSTVRAATPLLDLVGRNRTYRDHRVRHWAGSLAAVYDVERLAALDVPWWTYGAIAEMDTWLAERGHSARVLEYGSGASTRWLSSRSAEVHSVEHDAEFADVSAAICADRTNVSFHVVPSTRGPSAVRSARKGHELDDFSDYVSTGARIGGHFDLVVVDGRARADCLLSSVSLLSSSGRIVFDNSRRRRYRPAIESSGLLERVYRGLTPTLPYPDQTSVLSSAGTSR